MRYVWRFFKMEICILARIYGCQTNSEWEKTCRKHPTEWLTTSTKNVQVCEWSFCVMATTRTTLWGFGEGEDNDSILDNIYLKPWIIHPHPILAEQHSIIILPPTLLSSLLHTPLYLVIILLNQREWPQREMRFPGNIQNMYNLCKQHLYFYNISLSA